MDPNVDAILAIGGAMQAASFDAFAAAMADIARQTGKVVLQSGIGGGVSPDPSLARHGVAAFSSPERALRAYALVTGHAL
jgi:hypothetical protein